MSGENVKATGVGAINPADIQSSADAGAAVLNALKDAGPGTEMKVPVEVLKDLAASVVKLAAALATTPKSSPSISQVKAELKVTSAYSTPANQQEHLKELASKTRVKAIDLGLEMKVDVASDLYTGWYMTVGGSGPKDKLDGLRAFLNGELAVFGSSSGKLSVEKYDPA